jgi:hypothetical protein
MLNTEGQWSFFNIQKQRCIQENIIHFESPKKNCKIAKYKNKNFNFKKCKFLKTFIFLSTNICISSLMKKVSKTFSPFFFIMSFFGSHFCGIAIYRKWGVSRIIIRSFLTKSNLNLLLILIKILNLLFRYTKNCFSIDFNSLKVFFLHIITPFFLTRFILNWSFFPPSLV